MHLNILGTMGTSFERPEYRLWLDESGDHTYRLLDDPNRRYLALLGIFMTLQHYREVAHPQLESLKVDQFGQDPDSPIVIHREDIINRRGPFAPLQNSAQAKAFDDSLIALLSTWDFHIIFVVIDKKSRYEMYPDNPLHPYHTALALVLERYASFLRMVNSTGDVMAESRGGREDRLLKEAFQAICEGGTRIHGPGFFQSVLTSRKIKIRRKTENIAGLQIADVLAHPMKFEALREYELVSPGPLTFGRKLCQALRGKLYQNSAKATVRGYGLKVI